MLLFFLFFAMDIMAGYLFLLCVIGRGTEFSDRRELFIFSFPSGAALIILLLFTANQGVSLVLNRNSLFLCLATLTLLMALLLHFRSGGYPVSPLRRKEKFPSRKPHFYQRLCLVFILSTFIVFFIYKIMAPIYFWDAWSYHLPIAEKILRSGNLPTDVSLSSAELANAYPSFIPILYGIENILFGYPHYWLIKLFSFIFAALSCSLVYRISRLGLANDRGSALSAVIICLSMEMFLFYSVFASTTIVMNFFCLGAVYFLTRYLLSGEERWLYLIGVNLGFAYWVEYPGALFAAVFLLALFAISVIPSGRKDVTPLRLGVRGFTKICLPAFCIVLPHLARNLLLFGNPVYPALAGILGGKNIDAWAIQHSTNLPGLQGFALWFDVLHWGFLAPLFFLLYLFRGKWRKSSLELFIVALYFVYYIAYLLLLRYPPSAGDSSKFLIPILCLAAVLGGSVMKDMFTKGLRLSETVALIVLLMAWQIVTCRNELLLNTNAYWPITPLHSWRAWLGFLNGAIFDFYQTGLIVVVILCYILSTVKVSPWIKKSLLTLAMTIFMGQVFQQIAFPLIWHIDRAHKDPIYHYIEYINPRWLQPEGEWMEKNLPRDAMLFSFDSRFYIIPRRIVPADSYQLKELYQAKSVAEAVRILKTHGITHIHLNETAYPHPLYQDLPFLSYLDDPRYFLLVYSSRERASVPGGCPGIRIYKLI